MVKKECPECRGDGVAERINGYERPCDACHGKGYVTLPPADADWVEVVARVLVERRIRHARRFDTEPDRLEEMLPEAIDYSWQDEVEDAHAAISALAPLMAGEGWRPIEMAPRDGTVFDAWCQPSGYGNGFRIANVVWEPRYGAFFSNEEGILADDVIHWRPLPPPPAEHLNREGE